jgi:hypothetical protein
MTTDHPQEELLVKLNDDRTVIIPRRGFDDTAAWARSLGPGHVDALKQQVKRQVAQCQHEILPPPAA